MGKNDRPGSWIMYLAHGVLFRTASLASYSHRASREGLCYATHLDCSSWAIVVRRVEPRDGVNHVPSVGKVGRL